MRIKRFDDFVGESYLSGSRAPLYHTTAIIFASMVLNDDKLKAFKISSTPNVISFTRDKNFIYEDGPITFVVDQDKLKEDHTIKPFDYFVHIGSTIADTQKGNPKRDVAFEFEESVKGDIKNLHKYLIEIRINQTLDFFKNAKPNTREQFRESYEDLVFSLVNYHDKFGTKIVDSKGNPIDIEALRKESESFPTEFFMQESENKNLIPVVRWASRNYKASELQPQTFDWGGFESKALCFTPFDGMKDPRIDMWKDLLTKHHNKDLVKNFYYLDLSDFPLKSEKELTDFAKLTYKSLKAERMMKEDYKIHMTLSQEFTPGNPQIIEIRLLEGCKIKILEYVETGINKVAEKFSLINKCIEEGIELPKNLCKNFITFPLVDDPYSALDELKSFTKRDPDSNDKSEWVIWSNGDLYVNPTNQDRLKLGYGTVISFRVDPKKKEVQCAPYDDWADTKVVLNVQKALKDMIRAKYIDDTWTCIIMTDKLTKRSLGSKKVKDILNADYTFANVIPYAYHGTSDYFLDDIKTKGLMPREQSGEEENWDKGYTSRSEEMVYMTIDYNRANYYADYAVDSLAERGIKSKPIVVLVKNLPTANIEMDDDLVTNMGMLQLLALLQSGKSKEEFAQKASYITGIRQSGQFAVKGRIPASMITKIYKEKHSDI